MLGWDADRVHAAMNSGPNNTSVRIPNRVPVYIVYFTAYARDGQVYFGDDIYGRDDALQHKVDVDSAAMTDSTGGAPARDSVAASAKGSAGVRAVRQP